MKYHVCPQWDGKDLESLEDIYGEDEAIDIFLRRWPDANESMAMEHINKVWLYTTLEEAQSHQAECGGEILEINEEGLEIKKDIIEGYYYVYHNIPAENIKSIK